MKCPECGIDLVDFIKRLRKMRFMLTKAEKQWQLVQGKLDEIDNKSA